MPICAADVLIPDLQESTLSPAHPDRLSPLLAHVVGKVAAKYHALREMGVDTIEILDADWSRDNPEQAGQLHAGLIHDIYGSTYAMPTKYPEFNTRCINEGTLDMYFMRVNGKDITGTACLVDQGNGVAELGRAVARPDSGNGIIQDLRLIRWLTDPDESKKYHTIFTTLRSAPDRIIDGDNGQPRIMKGGQRVTEHWQKFGGLMVEGFAPMYLKHGALEQFTRATISNADIQSKAPLYVDNPDIQQFVQAWHDNHGLEAPQFASGGPQECATFSADYPHDSELTKLVHADIRADNVSGSSITDCIAEVREAHSPFTQIFVPINTNTTQLQADLTTNGFQYFGYQHTSDAQPGCLLFGKVAESHPIIPTHWDDEGKPNPLWRHPYLRTFARQAAQSW